MSWGITTRDAQSKPPMRYGDGVPDLHTEAFAATKSRGRSVKRRGHGCINVPFGI